jgi:hypothetical protein
MKYNLQFVKISDQHQIAGVGFAGNIGTVLNTLVPLTEEDRLFVDMASFNCICSENDTEYFGTNNCWEYYFEQNTISENEANIKYTSLEPNNLPYEDRNYYLDTQKFKSLKNKFYLNFKLKENVQEIINTFFINNIKDKITLGVQIRLTDMLHHHNVTPLSGYINKINQILKEQEDIEQIFLATDDGTIIDILRTEINIPIICYEDMYRANSIDRHTDPYDRLLSTRKHHRYLLGLECLQEILTLAKCDYLLKADLSAISIVAIILNENIKKIYKL